MFLSFLLNTKNLAEKLKSQLVIQLEQQEKMELQFASVASKILADNSQKFSEQNKESMQHILNPLKEKISEFEKRVESTNKDSIDMHATLRQQISGLRELNEQMSKEALNLTKALKGDSKIQGNWGELVLERVLEKSGLEKGREYEIQQSFTLEDGSRVLPDVVINLPDGKKMIVDSKVSLTAYEQYGWRDVDGNTYSLELCGGTHVRQTGDIGGFVLLSDGASSAGVRRIEALTGVGAEHYIQQQMAAMAAAATTLKVQPTEIADRAQQLLEERKALQNEVANLRRELALSGGTEAAATDPISIGGKAFLAQVLQGVTGRDLPALVDAHKAKMGSGVVLLIADTDGKAAVAAGVTGDLTEHISAVDIVKTVVATLGGKGGGGRADMAQGGAKSAENSDAAISAVKTLLEE